MSDDEKNNEENNTEETLSDKARRLRRGAHVDESDPDYSYRKKMMERSGNKYLGFDPSEIDRKAELAPHVEQVKKDLAKTLEGVPDSEKERLINLMASSRKHYLK